MAGLSRRRMLASAAATGVLLAAPRLVRAQSPALHAQLPGWASLRLAVPNSPKASHYASFEQIAHHGDRFISENLTKTGFTLPSAQAGRAPDALSVDFSAFRKQVATLKAAGARDPVFDLHGTYWHNSLSKALSLRLQQEPRNWRKLIERLHATHVAPGRFARFDINEVQRTTARADQRYRYWRGPADALKNGSLWYQAAAAAPDAHDPGYWWLYAAQLARGGPADVIYQDFNLEAGRPWGANVERAPRGLRAQTHEMLKRRRILDAINYALVHGGRIDVMGLQTHLAADRALDETDLRLFLTSLQAMGVTPEVTELDVEAGESRRAPTSAAYTAYALGQLMDNSRLFRIGAWTGWAPKGGRPRETVLSREGPTPVGQAVVYAVNAAAAPSARPQDPAHRFYQLCFGVTDDLWRAATAPERPGFEAEGNAAGTRAAPGSGGAVLPLTNQAARPKGPVGPVWRDQAGTAPRDADPEAMALTIQWQAGRGQGPVLGLGRRTSAPSVQVLVEGGSQLILRSADRDHNIARMSPGPVAVALSWQGGVLRALAGPRGDLVELSLPVTPDQVWLMGDGVKTSDFRATCLTLWRRPAANPDDLRRRARPLGARIRSPQDIAGTFTL